MKHKLQSLTIVVLSLFSMTSTAFIAVNWTKLSKTDAPAGPTGALAKKKKASNRNPASAPPESNRRDLALMSEIQTKSGELQACYNDFLQRSSTESEALVRMSWVIDPQGAVNSVTVGESEIDDAAFNDCLLGRVKNWAFKAAADTPSFLVNQKFTFRPRLTGSTAEFE